MLRSPVAALLCFAVVAGCSPAAPPPPAPPDPQHVQDVEAWRAKRDARLHAEDGWLTLVGLSWLKEGDNRFGSAPDNEVVLPASVGAHAGVLAVAGDTVTLRAEPGAGVQIDGKEATTAALVSDQDGADPTVVHVGSVSFYAIVREGKLVPQVGYVGGKAPRDRGFKQSLERELDAMRTFLLP